MKIASQSSNASRREYDRDSLREYFLANWHRLFGALRKSKALEVPSDQLRKELMVSRLLDLIEGEYAQERAVHHFNSARRGRTAVA
jgi:hypothetical protein